jgi:hypothetical protein
MIALTALALATPATAKKSEARNAPAKSERLYCFRYESLVGSRIAKQECNTKSRWARLGVDVDNPSRR